MSTATATISPTTDTSLQAYLTQQAQNAAADKAASSSTTASATKLGSNFNTFIKILTTQLQHQDPTSATDPNQFTQELVQFAGVEQQLGTNTKLDQLLNLQKSSNGTIGALSYIGKYVEAASNGQVAVQSGQAEIGYNLKLPASAVAITVQDSTGKTVATLKGSVSNGLNYVTWDGKDSDGNQLPDGGYNFTLVAKNIDGTAQTVADTRVIGKVTGVTTNSDGTTNLSVGNGVIVKTSDVDAAYDQGNLPASTVSAS